MKIMLLSFAVLATVTLSGCVAADQQPRAAARSGKHVLSREQQIPSRLETIAYDWEASRVCISFYRQGFGEPWSVTVRDSWNILDQSTKREGKVWGVSESRCSAEDCLRILDQSLAKFSTEKPSAKVESVALEMQINRQLWSEILAALSRRLAIVQGEKPANRIDVPDEVAEEIGRVLDNSPAIAAIMATLKKHGMAVQSTGIAEHIIFKDSLAGQKWSAIATLPGVGILTPGTVEFAIRESQVPSGPR